MLKAAVDIPGIDSEMKLSKGRSHKQIFLLFEPFRHSRDDGKIPEGKRSFSDLVVSASPETSLL